MKNALSEGKLAFSLEKVAFTYCKCAEEF